MPESVGTMASFARCFWFDTRVSETKNLQYKIDSWLHLAWRSIFIGVGQGLVCFVSNTVTEWAIRSHHWE